MTAYYIYSSFMCPPRNWPSVKNPPIGTSGSMGLRPKRHTEVILSTRDLLFGRPSNTNVGWTPPTYQYSMSGDTSLGRDPETPGPVKNLPVQPYLLVWVKIPITITYTEPLAKPGEEQTSLLT